MDNVLNETLTCYHCGEECGSKEIRHEEKIFCCQGCKTVYEILNKVQLCDYYQLNHNPGINRKNAARKEKFAFLDDESVQNKLIHFRNKDQCHVTFYLPQMHCSSCIWLLENLHKLNAGVISARVNFLKKEVTIVFRQDQITLRKLVELCNDIGYEPHLSLNDISEKKVKKYDKTRIYKIGVAGFCFGNIMMLSFPEYFSFGNIEEKDLKTLFSYLNVLLALPVFFYSASEFFISAWKGLMQKFLNIDAPIALAVIITFARSLYEILSGTGAGYLDSMSGIVFFMLVGRFFQDKTYNTLTFNRDYTSYFPIAVTVLEEGGSEKQVPVSKLKIGQRIKIHNQEIIPADSILFLGKASIDYSFVTGESIPVEKSIGEIVYAGGKQVGGALELEIVKEVSQSYLTSLWENEAFQKEKTNSQPSFIHRLSKYFTIGLFAIAAASAVYWKINDPSKILDAITALLIVACPCALLLSATFTNGNLMQHLQKIGFFARNAAVLERISNATAIVFDKTGTITLQKESRIVYEGMPLPADLVQQVRSLVYQSSHPISKAILATLRHSQVLPVKQFSEQTGLGISGMVRGNKISIGSADYIFGPQTQIQGGSGSYLSLNNQVIGFYSLRVQYREGLDELVHSLKQKYRLSLLSGDNASEKKFLKSRLGENTLMLFEQKPQDKLEHIRSLQRKGEKVIMLGDGLNDAGALQQADAGIAITDNINNFSPGCDVIMEGKNFQQLGRIFEYCRKGKRIIIYSFVISLLYNLVGLYFAFFAKLEPVIAAILMPLSSISIILFTTGTSALLSFVLLRNKPDKNISTPKKK